MNTIGKAKSEFIKLFNQMAYNVNDHELFRDFVTMSAISIINSIAKNEKLEAEYLTIIKKYRRDDQLKFPELFAILHSGLEEPNDFLGAIYMELGIGNAVIGQYFSPYPLCEMMAELTYGDHIRSNEVDYYPVSEPTAGSGAMIIAFAHVMLKKGVNPQKRLLAHCVELDRTVAMMCYIQLSLLGIPATVCVGNSLSNKMFEVFYTPMYYLDDWPTKIKVNEMMSCLKTLFANDCTSPVDSHPFDDVSQPVESERLNMRPVKLEQIDLFSL